jgi:hypothetical protein
MACDAVAPSEAAGVLLVLRMPHLSPVARGACIRGRHPAADRGKPFGYEHDHDGFTPPTSGVTVTLIDPGNGSATGAPRLIGDHVVAG